MSVHSTSVLHLAGSVNLLAGAKDGAMWFRAARQALEDAEPGLHGLDFSKVRLATVSWLREGVLALQADLLARRPDLHLLALNPSSVVEEELNVALEAAGRVMVAAKALEEGALRDPVLLGKLDHALAETFLVVQGRESFDASSVAEALSERGVGLTAASNRLAELAKRGVLCSEKRGRSRVYRPIVEGLVYGQ